MSTPTVVPLDAPTAERIAALAVRSPVNTTVGPRVLAGLLARIAALTAELERRDALDLEAARLRAHAMRGAR